MDYDYNLHGAAYQDKPRFDNVALDAVHIMEPSPADGADVPAGSVVLGWVNLYPNTGSDVWVDVWYGTDPGALALVVDAGLNTTNTTVSAPGADTYYWRVDSYLDGSPGGAASAGTLFTFNVTDSDSDGLPDDFELAYTAPPSATSMNPGDDLENGGAGDGLTNLQEYQLGTDATNPDTDGDTLQDGPEVAGASMRPPTNPADAYASDQIMRPRNPENWVTHRNRGFNSKPEWSVTDDEPQEEPLMVFDGTNAVSSGLTAAEGSWTRFTTQSDYATKTWTVHVNGKSAGPYGFYNTSETSYKECRVTGESEAIDDVRITLEGPRLKKYGSIVIFW